MGAKKMGRPAAKWVQELAQIDESKHEYLDYHDLSKMFGLTIRSVHGFCAKAGVSGEYFKHESKVVRKRFSAKELKRAASAYLAQSILS